MSVIGACLRFLKQTSRPELTTDSTANEIIMIKVVETGSLVAVGFPTDRFNVIVASFLKEEKQGTPMYIPIEVTLNSRLIAFRNVV